jgi:hypothetical protein
LGSRWEAFLWHFCLTALRTNFLSQYSDQELTESRLISGKTAKIREPTTLGLLITAILLVPAFVVWVGRQERLGRPAIIPNSLWRNRVFSVICLGVFITWGVFNAIETYLTLFFQDVQKISAIQTSIRFLPAPIAGAIANVVREPHPRLAPETKTDAMHRFLGNGPHCTQSAR